MAKKQAKGVTRAEILEVGVRLFREKGPDLTMQDVANAAGVSRQMVYNYFKTRGGLLTALARQMDEQSGVEAQLLKITELEDAEQRTRAFVEAWLLYVHGISGLANELVRQKQSDDAAQAAYADRMSNAEKWFHTLAASLEADDAPSTAVRERAQLLLAILSPQVYEILSTQMKWSRKKIIAEMGELIAGVTAEK